MTEQSRLESHLKGIIQKLLVLCDLTIYRFQIRYQKDAPEDCSFSIGIDDEYYRLVVFYSADALEEKKLGNDNWILYALCHEIAHVYTHGLYRKAISAQTNQSMQELEKSREQVTERISRLIEGLYYSCGQGSIEKDSYRWYNYAESKEETENTNINSRSSSLA